MNDLLILIACLGPALFVFKGPVDPGLREKAHFYPFFVKSNGYHMSRTISRLAFCIRYYGFLGIFLIVFSAYLYLFRDVVDGSAFLVGLVISFFIGGAVHSLFYWKINSINLSNVIAHREDLTKDTLAHMTSQMILAKGIIENDFQ